MASMAPDVAVIGGSGLYRFLPDNAREMPVSTPFGETSAPVAVGCVEKRAVAFLPRHGPGHRYPAHRIPARANLWALRSLGVRPVLAPCAAGSLVPDRGPGTLVVPDQLLRVGARRSPSPAPGGPISRIARFRGVDAT